MSEDFFDWQLWQENGLLRSYQVMSGTDEVGRGPLAGPVVSCTVGVDLSSLAAERVAEGLLSIFQALRSLGIGDSKKLDEKLRLQILKSLGLNLEELQGNTLNRLALPAAHEPLYFALGVVSPQEIDRLNILQASLLSMSQSYFLCEQGWNRGSEGGEKVSLLLVDGKFTIPQLPARVHQIPLIRGDDRSLLIGLASIIAKEFRDYQMREWDKVYPGYEWASNAGYPTKIHKEKIASLGPSPLHRLTFKGVREFVIEGR